MKQSRRGITSNSILLILDSIRVDRDTVIHTREREKREVERRERERKSHWSCQLVRISWRSESDRGRDQERASAIEMRDRQIRDRTCIHDRVLNSMQTIEYR